MIVVAIIIDTLSALHRDRYDEYQIVILEKIFLFHVFFYSSIVSTLFGSAYTCTDAFCRNHFCTHSPAMDRYDCHRTMVSHHPLQRLIKR